MNLNNPNYLNGLTSSASEIDDATFAVNKTLGLPNKALKIGALGDSITRNMIEPSTKTFGDIVTWAGANWLLRAVSKLNGRAWADIYSVEGYSGKRTDEIYDLMLPSTSVLNPTHTTPQPYGILANKPDVVIEFSGTNDSYFGYTKEHMVTGRRAIWQRLIANGITPIALSLLPNSLTGIKNTQIPEWNALIKEEAEKMGIVFIDIYTNCADGTNWKAGYDYIGNVPDPVWLHPGSEGCISIANDLAAVLDKLIGSRVSTPTVYSTSSIYTKPYSAILKGEEYKLFNSDDGLFSNISNWAIRYQNARMSSVRAVVDDNDFTKFGNTLTTTFTSIDTTGEAYSDFTSPSVTVTPGTKVGVFFKFEINCVNVGENMNIGVVYNGDVTLPIYSFRGGNGGDKNSTSAGAGFEKGDFYYEFIVPNGCTSIKLFVTFAFDAGVTKTGTVMKFAQVGTVKVN